MAEMNKEQKTAHVMWMRDVPAKDIANSIGKSPKTIETWRKKFGWPTKAELRARVELDEEIPAPTFDVPESGTVDPDEASPTFVMPDDPVVGDEIAELKRQLLSEQMRRVAAEKRAQAAEQAAFDASPVVDISDWMWDTPEKVIEFHRTDKECEDGVLPKKLTDLAYKELAHVNRERNKQGQPALQIPEEELAARVFEIAASILQKRIDVRDDNSSRNRAIKMMDVNGNLRQVMIENQVNNHVGSIADSVVRYLQKGWKHTSPNLCASYNCWDAAADDQLGYCSAEHRTFCETGKNAAMTSERMNLLRQAQPV